MADIISFEAYKQKHLLKAKDAKKKLVGSTDPSLSQSLEGLIEELFRSGDGGGSTRVGAFVSATGKVSLLEEGKSLKVKFNVNGLLKEELRLRLTENILYLDIHRLDEGEPLAESQKHGVGVKALSQCLPLPYAVQKSTAKATLQGGELVVELHRELEAKIKEKEIPISDIE